MPQKTSIFFLLILILAVFLRFFNFHNTFAIGTDSATGLINAENIVRKGKPLLLWYGPTELNIIAPTYPHIMAVIFFLTQNEKVIALIFSIFGTASIILIYLLTRKTLGIRTALLAMLISASSYEMINYSRTIFPTALAPFFLLLSFYFIICYLKENRPFYILFSHLSFLISLMYISSFLFLLSFILLNLILLFRKKDKLVLFFKILIFFLVSLLLIYHPVFIYHFNSDFIEFREIEKSFADFGNLNLFNYLTALINQVSAFIKGYFLPGVQSEIYISALIIASLSILIFAYFNISKKFLFFFLIPLLTGFLLSGFYTRGVYLHRLLPFFPLFSAIFAYSLAKSFKKAYSGIFIFLTVLFLFTNMNSTAKYIYQHPPAFHHQIKPAEYIKSILGNNSHSIYVIAPEDYTNFYATEYIYALNKLQKKPNNIYTDHRGEIYNRINSKAEYLILICRDFNNQIEIYLRCLDNFYIKYPHLKLTSSKTIYNLEIFAFKNQIY